MAMILFMISQNFYPHDRVLESQAWKKVVYAGGKSLENQFSRIHLSLLSWAQLPELMVKTQKYIFTHNFLTSFSDFGITLSYPAVPVANELLTIDNQQLPNEHL